MSRISNWHKWPRENIYVVCNIIPRVILISVLCLDVFYFHKLHIIYKVILLALIPLTHRYIKYSLNEIKELLTKQLEAKYDGVWVLDEDFTELDWKLNPRAIYHDTTVSVREFINIQTNRRQDSDETIYTGDPNPREEVFMEYRRNKYKNNTQKLTQEDYDPSIKNLI